MNRLPFGVTSAPSIFQRTLEQIIKGTERTSNSQDDILVSGTSVSDHLCNLDGVLTRLEKHNIKVNLEKSKFLLEEVEYLGHKINAQGLHPTNDKVIAIMDASIPQNVTQLKSYLGLLNYYHKFLPNVSSILHPLHCLLRKDTPWKWTRECSQSYQQTKELLTSCTVLAHYDPDLPISLACDASFHGIGVVLSHVFPGAERPIAFASRTLSRSEENYSQIDKEALAIVFGIKKFHQYLYGRHFTLVTDHKPLTSLFSPTAGIPTLAAARLQRWALCLSAHQYDIKFRSSSEHANADALSRLPCGRTDSEDVSGDCVDMFYNTHWEPLPVSSKDIASATKVDPILATVTTHLSKGWTQLTDPCLKPYFVRRHEMSFVQGCITWGLRVVVPKSVQNAILEELHNTHPGIVRMKEIARSYVWWPQIDQMIEDKVKTCKSCQQQRNAPPPSPLHPWIWPSKPWSRVHIDYAGPIRGHMLFILVDAHSKWPEVYLTKSTTSETTIKCLKDAFSRWGLPDSVVSDNGPQFRSEEFTNFAKQNGVKHIFTPPYHPSSNGQVERFVRTVKRAITRNSKSLTDCLANFLLIYRNTSHPTTQCSPASLMLRRNLQTRMDLLRPNPGRDVENHQSQQLCIPSRARPMPSLTVGDPVLSRDYSSSGNKWVPARVQNQCGPLSFEVSHNNGGLARRHWDQLLPVSPSRPTLSTATSAAEPPVSTPDALPVVAPSSVEPRYPARVRRPVSRLNIGAFGGRSVVYD